MSGQKGYHESETELSAAAKDQHRAVESLMEELEAVDWYSQRIEAAQDQELKDILAHNRDEEIEHAVMILEWLRRNVPKFDEEMRARLFKTGRIAAEDEDQNGAAEPRDLGIGSLKPRSTEEASR